MLLPKGTLSLYLLLRLQGCKVVKAAHMYHLSMRSVFLRGQVRVGATCAAGLVGEGVCSGVNRGA